MEERWKNVIIAWLSENDVVVFEYLALGNDVEKFVYILSKIGLDEEIWRDDINNFTYTEIGTVVDDRSRMFKVTVPDNHTREAIMTKVATLRTLEDRQLRYPTDVLEVTKHMNTLK